MTTPPTWLITGAGRGLGRALTQAVLAAGHAVAATVRGDDHSLTPHGRLRTYHLDVRDRDAAHRVVRQVADDHGGLDVLVNNAGYGLVGAIEEVGEAEARSIVDTDLFGPLWTAQAAIPVMRAQGGGHIVQISTTGAVGSMPTLGLYNAAKWGLEGFSEAMAAEVQQFGIRVTLAELGAVDTEWGTASMRFATPLSAYDDLRQSIFGTTEVPWPGDAATSGGSTPEAVAEALLRHVDSPGEGLRLLVGDDAPGQVATVLAGRSADYRRDERFRRAEQGTV